MRALSTKENVEAPGGNYPYGRIRDKTSTTRGTKVNENVYGDFHQFFAHLANEAGVTANGEPDNDYVGFQLFEAFKRAVSKVIGRPSTTDELDSATTNLNDFWYPGNFEITSSFTNIPTGLSATALLQVFGYGNSITQKITDGVHSAEWTRTGNGVTWGSWTLIRLATKELQIGDWDMNASDSVTVAHGLSGSGDDKIRTISCVIRNDSGTYFNLEAATTSGVTEGGIQFTGGTVITLLRTIGGTYDSTSFDSTSYNRGFITIEYDPTV